MNFFNFTRKQADELNLGEEFDFFFKSLESLEGTEETGITLPELLTIKDLVDISGYRDPEFLLLMVLLFQNLSGGSFCLALTLDNLGKKLKNLSKGAESLAKKIIEKVLAGNYSQIISEDPNAFYPIILKSKSEKPALYFQKYHAAELNLINSLKALLRKNESEQSAESEQFIYAYREIFFENPLLFNKKPLEVNKEVKLFFLMAFLNRFSLLSGGPGTGKTTIIANLVRLFLRLGYSPEEIRLAAPTGRAAKRIGETLKIFHDNLGSKPSVDALICNTEALTVHRLLNYSSFKKGFIHNKWNKIPARLIIIDEISMVDLVLMSSLLEALDENCKLIIIGDKDQLPSVEAGRVLADLLPKNPDFSISLELSSLYFKIYKEEYFSEINRTVNISDHTLILKKSYRSGSAIQKLAEKINRQDITLINDLPATDLEKIMPEISSMISKPGCHLIKAEKEETINYNNFLGRFAEETLLSSINSGINYVNLASLPFDFNQLNEPDSINRLDPLFYRINSMKFLCLIKDSLRGTHYVNGFLTTLFKKNYNLATLKNDDCFPGLPIIILKNDYTRNIFNGETGIILRNSVGEMHAVFSGGGGYFSYPAEVLPPFDKAFAVTVHKCQGSEYEKAVVILPENEASRLLTKEILYTAVTRAKSSIILYGTEKILRTALQRKIERESGLSQELFPTNIKPG